MGVALIPRMAAAPRTGVVMRDLGPAGPVRHVTAAVRRGGETGRAVTRVLEALREAAAAPGHPGGHPAPRS